jgi:hypothetical protein
MTIASPPVSTGEAKIEVFCTSAGSVALSIERHTSPDKLRVTAFVIADTATCDRLIADLILARFESWPDALGAVEDVANACKAARMRRDAL